MTLSLFQLLIYRPKCRQTSPARLHAPSFRFSLSQFMSRSIEKQYSIWSCDYRRFVKQEIRTFSTVPNYALVQGFVVKHVTRMNVASKPCIQNDTYNVARCVARFQQKMAGCVSPWERAAKVKCRSILDASLVSSASRILY